MRLCSMWLCSKLLGGRGLTRAAFYHISTDSVLALSLSGSLTSCLASLRPFIEILRSLVTEWCFACIYSLLGVSSIFAKAQISCFLSHIVDALRLPLGTTSVKARSHCRRLPQSGIVLQSCTLQSLDFLVNQFFVKLLNTRDIQTVTECQLIFGFELPIAS